MGSSTATAEVRGGISIRGLRKDFGETTAIKHLDLDIEPGEFISLLGPSGCGKTTLLRMIAGFEDPTNGEILLDGSDLTALPPYKRPVNTVFQSYALFPHLNVAENVAYGLKRAKVPRSEIPAKVKEALRLVRMQDFADRRPDKLSGGQQQRIALARAIVNRPRVLLLDEPMSALDRKLREEMQLELIRLHGELGLTFVFVTHDQEEALAMSDRIVVMSDGIIQQIGQARDIYQTPSNSFVAGFIGKQNFIDGTVSQADEHGVTMTVKGSTVHSAAAAPKGVTVDCIAAATIRPEAVRVSADDQPADVNRVLGTLLGESFLGDVVQYLVRVDSGTEILARTPAAEAPQIEEGDRVSLSWDAADVRVFPHESEQSGTATGMGASERTGTTVREKESESA